MTGILQQPHAFRNGNPLLDKAWHRTGHYLLRLEALDSNVKILLTNTQLLWHTSLSKDDIVGLAKSQNTAMEASDERFLSASLELLHHGQENLTCQSAEDGRTATCVFKTSLQDFSFSLSVELEQADIQQYYREITLPLLTTIHHYQREQEELMKLIQRKDEEIAEYKLAGATLSRKGIATKFFNKEEFLKTSKTKDTAGESPFQAGDVCRHTLLRFSEISAKYEKKEEKKETTIKTEPGVPACEPSASNQTTKRASIQELPVLNLPKRPRSGKLARLI